MIAVLQLESHSITTPLQASAQMPVRTLLARMAEAALMAALVMGATLPLLVFVAMDTQDLFAAHVRLLSFYYSYYFLFLPPLLFIIFLICYFIFFPPFSCLLISELSWRIHQHNWSRFSWKLLESRKYIHSDRPLSRCLFLFLVFKNRQCHSVGKQF